MMKKILLAGAVLFGAWAGVAHAQAERPLRFIVGTPAGSSLDSVARLAAQEVGAALNRSAIVENKSGAAGRIAAEFVKTAPADGDTVWITASANVVAQPLSYANLRYDPFKDFVPLAGLASFEIALVVPSQGAKTVSEYLKAAAQDPSKALFGSPSAGSQMHFLGVLLSQESGVALSHVPYQGTAPLMPAVIGGHVPAGMVAVADAVPYHKSGRLRVLAVSGERRSRYLPDVATFKELGLNVVGKAWFGAYVRAGTPQAVVDVLGKAMTHAVAQASVQESLKALSLDPLAISGSGLAKLQLADWNALGPVIKASGFKGED